MSHVLPTAQPVHRLSPSSYEVLRMCPLRLGFGQESEGPAPRTDSALVGEACHEVLESLVADGLMRSGRWSEEVDRRFEAAIAARPFDPDRPVRGVTLARARLRKTCGRVAALLAQAPVDADLITEAQLEAADGRLTGRVDLIIRSAELHVIVDYKTGTVSELDGHPKEQFRRQLMLYACLEAAEHGWPHRAHLMPLGREAIELPIEPSECQALLHEALSALDRWQAGVGGVPPAFPSPETCQRCPYAARCPAMWEAWADDWAVTLAALSGKLLSSSSTPLGGTTISLRATRGSTLGDVAVRNIDFEQHPGLVDAEPGDEISIVGLRPDEAEGVWSLAPWARSHRESRLELSA